jgi:hypothetical protein
MDHRSIDFIGIGAPRCGTTWLAECLRQHPDVRMPLRTSTADGELAYADLTDAKELNFFTVSRSTGTYFPPLSNWHKGLAWYMDRFPPAEPGKVRGEITPDYLRDPLTPGLIKQTFPDVKLIVALRDPADMVYSLYTLHSYGTLSKSFEELLDEGLYLEPGLYAEQLSRYLELFPRERIHIVLFDDIAARPREVARDLYTFLGIDPSFVPTVIGKKVNAARTVRSSSFRSVAGRTSAFLRLHARSLMNLLVPQNGVLHRAYLASNLVKKPYPPMRPETRARLRGYFAKDIARLETMLGRDLSTWKTS